MSNNKKMVRSKFRKDVLERDRFKCRVCGVPGTDETLDPHHITDRNDMPNGGYVKENGISLCKAEGGCHEKAEACLNGVRDREDPVYGPKALYALIGSSHDKAIRASNEL